MSITNRTILVLCDDQIQLHRAFTLAARLVSMSERSYAMFKTSEKLLEKLNGQNIEAMLIDWNLIGSVLQKGELIKELVKRRPDVPVYILSTSDNKKEMQVAQESGAKGWIVKTSLIMALRRWKMEKDDIPEWHVWRG